jgi:hypothetical protein
MSKQQSTKKLMLAAAAEALVEAASLEADAMSQKQLAQNLDSLKVSFDSNLITVVQTLKASNENLDAKINTLNQHLTGVKNEINALKSLLEEEKKQKTLERALGLTDINSFQYYEFQSNGISKEGSTEWLAKRAIKLFIMGYGMVISSNYSLVSYDRGEASKSKSKEEFREEFKEQIKQLIQREPRMYRQDNGDFAIHYS